MVSFCLIPAGRVAAQTFKLLHDFTTLNNSTNSDGASPAAGLILSGNTLYGTTWEGGSSSNGTVFAVNTDGTGFTTLHSFTATRTNGPTIPQSPAPALTNNDGAHPQAGLLLVGGTLYGTTTAGGTNGNGTIFAVNTNGMDFTTLHEFTGVTDGGAPQAALIFSGTTLYGTASSGPDGNVFAINTNGTGFTVVHDFMGFDAAYPSGRLILSGELLYGVTKGGGTEDLGTVYAVYTNHGAMTLLYSFTNNPPGTDGGGFMPFGGLVLSGKTLYGTATSGGLSLASGTVFAVNTVGPDFKTLHEFAVLPPYPGGFGTNSDGASPIGGLILVGNTLYGTTAFGGIDGSGTIFSINTNGMDFKTVYYFAASHTNSSGIYTNCDGTLPWAGLLRSGCTLYGTTRGGGSAGSGTVFSLSFPPQLNIALAGTNVILTWPTNVAGFDYSGFTLQSTTNLYVAPVWNPVSPAPVIVQGQNIVTNPVSSTVEFYRLSQ